MNAFLVLSTTEGVTILVNYFNALGFVDAGDKTTVLLASGESIVVEQSIEEIEAEIRQKAVWVK